MIEVMVLSFALFCAVALIMSVGVIFSDKCIQGSCGGLNLLFGKGSCEVCEKKKDCEDKVSL